jgi:integrase
MRGDLLRALAEKFGIPVDDGPTVRELFERRVRSVGKPTQKRMRFFLLPMLEWRPAEGEPSIGETPALLLKCTTLWAYRTWRLEQPGRAVGSKIAPGTVRTEFASAKALMNWAVDAELIDHNPLARLKTGRIPKRKGNIRGEKVDTLRVSLPEWANALVLLCANTGMRIGTAIELRWDDINFETGQITPSKPESATKRHGEPWMMDGSPERAALLELRSKSPPDSPWVFTSPKRRRGRWRPYSYGYFHKLFQRAAASAGIKTDDGYTTIHHLRHGFKLQANEEWGWTLAVIARRMGHASVETTRGYGAIDAEALEAAHRRAAEKIRKGPRGRGPSPDGTVIPITRSLHSTSPKSKM